MNVGYIFIIGVAVGWFASIAYDVLTNNGE